jgi:Flp pilus assembly protein TadD
MDYFHRAVDLDPECAPAWHNLGVTLARLGETRRALSALRNARHLEAGRAVTCVALGNLLAQNGLLEAALAVFAHAEELGFETRTAHASNSR